GFPLTVTTDFCQAMPGTARRSLEKLRKFSAERQAFPHSRAAKPLEVSSFVGRLSELVLIGDIQNVEWNTDAGPGIHPSKTCMIAMFLPVSFPPSPARGTNGRCLDSRRLQSG